MKFRFSVLSVVLFIASASMAAQNAANPDIGKYLGDYVGVGSKSSVSEGNTCRVHIFSIGNKIEFAIDDDGLASFHASIAEINNAFKPTPGLSTDLDVEAQVDHDAGNTDENISVDIWKSNLNFVTITQNTSGVLFSTGGRSYTCSQLVKQ
jgi:hypothetical protein